MKVLGAFVLMSVLGTAAFPQTPAPARRAGPEVYIAKLTSLNGKIAGRAAHGQARLILSVDQLTIDVSMQGVPPRMIHWQHLHGFPDGRPATCPTAAADTNHDGVIDITETAPFSGTTLVPFDRDPAGMDIAHGDYPKASAKGTYFYHETVSLTALQQAFTRAFPGQKLDLARRVIYVHGVPADTKLPTSVKSLDSIPAQVTLPIACGKLELQKRK